nr:disease resistance protein At4g27190-like [Coffea arabica]
MATVSQSPYMRNDQDQLAEQLGLKITEQTEQSDLARAERLYMKLTGRDKRILVILDDIWKEVDFKSFGIPIKGECKSFKVILTSRSSGVCRDMGAELFKVVEECKGLSLAIVVVATALKSNHTLESWDLALRQLRKDRMGNLRGVQDLVWKRATIVPGYREYLLVDELKSSYLLLNDGEKEDSIKLHDVVRDVCLSIASNVEHEFLVSNSGVGKKNSYTAILLISQDCNHDLLPFCKEYPRLRLLRLEFNSGKLNLPKDSFVGMEALRVMELNHSQIEFPLSWPNQILRSLRIRCLDFCRLGTGLSSMLGHMTQLETLSLFQSTLADDQSPTEIAQLSNLKLLDLSVKSSLHPLPNGILSSLKKLEELYLGSRDHLQLGRDKEEEIGCLKEISAISNLAWLQIVLYGLNLLLLSLQEFDTQSLSRFNITVTNHGGAINLNRSYQFQKSFNLYLKGGGDEGLKQVFDPKVTSIVERTENLILNLSYSSRLRNLMPNLDENGFINLKKLDLYYGHCECLIDFIANLIAKHIFEVHGVRIFEVERNMLRISSTWVLQSTSRGDTLLYKCFRVLVEGISRTSVALQPQIY